MTSDVEAAMSAALVEARSAAAGGDIPIGAVVLGPDGELIARSGNAREALQDPTAHAEIRALREAASVLGRGRLTDCTLVVTLEPCPMCAGAAVMSRVSRVVFGAWNDEYGAGGSRWDLLRDKRLPHRPEVISGVMSEPCGDLVRSFLAERRSQDLGREGAS